MSGGFAGRHAAGALAAAFLVFGGLVVARRFFGLQTAALGRSSALDPELGQDHLRQHEIYGNDNQDVQHAFHAVSLFL